MKKFVFLFGLAVIGTFALITSLSGQKQDWTPIETSAFRQVYLIRDTTKSDVELYLVFPSGEGANPYAEGLAHYVEHLAWLSAFSDTPLFTGTRDSNAWTTERTTAYWLQSSPADLAQSVAALARVAAPIDLDTEFALQERDILLREYEYRAVENPFFAVDQDMRRVLYQNGPLSRSVIGHPKDIASFDPSQARALHSQSHDLNKASLVVYGNVSARQVKRALMRVKPPMAVTTRAVDPALLPKDLRTGRNEASITVPGIGDRYLVYRKLFRRPPCGPPVQCDNLIYLTQTLLDSALPGGLAGPLRYDNFIARTFTITLTPVGMDHIELNFSATPDSGVSLAQIQTAFENTLESILSAGIPEKTFARLMQRDQDELKTIGNPAARTKDLVLDGLSAGTAIYGYSDEQDVHALISRKTMNAFLKALNQPGRVVIRHVRPSGDRN